MMDNKRGAVFGLYLVILTLLMIGTVVVLYNIQQRNANGSLVSPVLVLDARDKLENFEYREDTYSEGAFEFVKGKGLAVGSEEFAREFRRKFLDVIEEDADMKNFLLDGLVIDGKDASQIDLDYENFLENRVYGESSFYFEGGKLVVSRPTLTKRYGLTAPAIFNTRIRFPVIFHFEFERTFEVGSA